MRHFALIPFSSCLLASAALAASLPDLGKLDATVADCRAVVSDATKKPLERARARYQLLKLELLTCKDDAFLAKKAEMLAFIAKPGGLGPREMIDFLYGTVGADQQEIFVRPDIDRLADEASRGDRDARRAFWLRRMNACGWGDRNDYAPEKSWEHQLALVDGAEKDEVANYDLFTIAKWRLHCLKGLGRAEDCEKVAREAMGSAKEPWKRAELLMAIGDVRQMRANRYFAEPHAPTLLKAVEAYDQAIALCVDDKYLKGSEQHRKSLKFAAECLLRARDFTACRAHLKALEEATDEKRRPNLDAVMLLGDCAFAERKWEEAVAHYRSVGAKLGQKRRLNLGHALVALGRKREALAVLERIAKEEEDKYAKDRYGYIVERMRRELEPAGKAE